MDTPLSVSVIILNWNGRPYLEACLAALSDQDYRPDDVILVDNGSTDGSVAFVREQFPWVVVRENGGNVGFAAGNNTALRESAADVVVLLNPDVILLPGCLAALVAGLAADSRIGIAGGKLLYPGGEVIQHAGGYITHPQAMPGHFGIGERDEGQYDSNRDVDYVIGAVMAVRRRMLDETGLMDEGFFLYFEDADLCARARRAGYRVVYLPGATGVHVESATAVKGSFAYLQRFHSGRWRYLLKQFPAGELIGPTLAAEAEWLERIDPAERRAVALAYLATQRGLSGIWDARAREGSGALTVDEQTAVAEGLAALRERARAADFDAGAAGRLAEAAVLTERPFISGVPILGPLIAWFRTAWNNVASRWYVGHLMNQQNEFNRLAVVQLRQYEAELQEQLALLEEQIIMTAELQQRVDRLQAHVADLRRRMKAGPVKSSSENNPPQSDQ